MVMGLVMVMGRWRDEKASDGWKIEDSSESWRMEGSS
jgi:hypothetical protein